MDSKTPRKILKIPNYLYTSKFHYLQSQLRPPTRRATSKLLLQPRVLDLQLCDLHQQDLLVPDIPTIVCANALDDVLVLDLEAEIVEVPDSPLGDDRTGEELDVALRSYDGRGLRKYRLAQTKLQKYENGLTGGGDQRARGSGETLASAAAAGAGATASSTTFSAA